MPRSDQCCSATECPLARLERPSLIRSASCSAETADVEHCPSLALGASRLVGQPLLSRVAPPSNHLRSRPPVVIMRAQTCYG